MEKRKKIVIAAAAASILVILIGLQVLNSIDLGEDIKKSDIKVNITEVMLQNQQQGDNDVLANITISIDEEAPEPALISYISCTDCTTPATYSIIKPGETTNILYEYNLENQSVPVFNEHAIDFVGASRVPDKDKESGAIKSPRGYVNSEDGVKEIKLGLPTQKEIHKWQPVTITGEVEKNSKPQS